MNILLLQSWPKDWALNEWSKSNLPSYVLFRNVNKFLRGIRRFWILHNIPFASIWYSSLVKKNIKSFDVVVLHMSSLTMNLPQYINKQNPNARIIAWYWNIVDKNTLPQNVSGKCEFWSFDPEDCRKYNMHFNHQYYFKSLVKEPQKAEWDIFFCGSDSGRGEKLTFLYNEFVKQGLNVNFKIVYPKYEGIPSSVKSKPLDYKTIADYNSRSKALLEIQRPGQSGATVRLMEALFNKKKIITNNPFVKNEPFYNENNIFLLGERPLTSLKEFVDSGYDYSVDRYIDEYDLKKWLNNFGK